LRLLVPVVPLVPVPRWKKFMSIWIWPPKPFLLPEADRLPDGNDQSSDANTMKKDTIEKLAHAAGE
jgi:hypothetical protein